ncbi:inter-alpha-trypsin inhibitor heavy chain H3-like isoform X1 [Python bivittatus]|uniref:Inter-alpha-trypsin inhibitor heavy chain H3 n=2 Tax=Python bivittatus TaxID=176946 RepID=A0A9F2RDP0_PYTBI|nr:inter-alpha-trypsin inhibitor heavy chain H3-like isoform X2 [Python bivittatus]XP_025031859.1 inter-alpha-trypsin inhibitor heavy chain H3-like isoform X1 [Python bivittatus]
MGKHIPIYILLGLIPAVVISDILIYPLRNIKKRSATDVHTKGIEIYWMKIDCSVTSRFSRNVITSRAVNRANVSKEAFFDMELPKTGFITNFTMTIDGVIYPGIIKEKEVAQKQYQQAVSRGQTAGLVKAAGRKTEKFSVSVNIAPTSKVTFQLTYEELLKRNFGKYEMFIKVNPKQLVNSFEIEADIFEPQGISELEVEGTFINNDLLPVLKKSFSGKKGHVSFSPTIEQQRTCDNCTTTLLQGDFVIKYDVNRDSPNNLQIVNGYFVHFFAPKNLQRLPKNVAFVIDVSGSMYGQKIRQAKEALTKIVEDLKEEDHFNIILFESSVSTWKNKLIQATPENVNQSKEFISQIRDLGGTNLNDGLLTGIEMLNKAHESKSVPERSASLVIMLTDGQANEGVSDPRKIQENAKNATQGKYPIYNLGFGYGVDYAFLERLATENNGVARRIFEDSDAALQLQGFYDEVANPLLTEVELEYAENAISDLTQNSFKHFYDGSEIVVAGRITDNDLNSITAEVKAHGALEDLTYTEQADIEETAKAFEQQLYIFGEYIERLWAYLTINEQLEARSVAQGDEKVNLTAKALEMSLKYKFVTPLTSMVVTKPEDNEEKEAIADKPIEAEAKQQVSAYYPPSTPYHYSSVDGDPHFIIAVPQQEDALCFNINEEPGVVLNLINDPVTGVTVNGQLIGDKKSINDVRPPNTYFGKLGIITMNVTLEITTQKIVLQNDTVIRVFSWLDDVTLQEPSLTLIIKQKRSMEVSVGNGAKFVVVLHQVWKKHPLHRDFLGFYMLDSHRLSEETHGLLGQFFHPIGFDILEVHPGSDPEKPDATMTVKNNQLTVTRGWQKDYTADIRHGTNIPCWFIHNNGKGLIDGNHTDYIVPSIFSYKKI